MQKIKFSNASQEYSRIISGVMRWGSWGHKLSTADMSQLIESNVELGITTFDHADIYGDYSTEAEFGQALSASAVDRNDVQLITKCGIKMKSDARPDNKIKSYDTSKAYIISSVEQSLRNLQTDYIDQLLIHRPGPLMHADDIIEAFTILKEQGKVIDFGVSNFTQAQFDKIHRFFPLTTNQLEVSVVQLQSFVDGNIDYLQAEGISPQSWSPLGGAELFKPQSRYETVLRNGRLHELRQAYGWSVTELALLFLLHHPANICPVIGTANIDHVKDSVQATNLSISDEQWYEIWTACTGQRVP